MQACAWSFSLEDADTEGQADRVHDRPGFLRGCARIFGRQEVAHVRARIEPEGGLYEVECRRVDRSHEATHPIANRLQ